MKKRDILRGIPKIDEVLDEQLFYNAIEANGRNVVTDAARAEVDGLRERILALTDKEAENFDKAGLDALVIAKKIMDRLEEQNKSHLHSLINATGTILHTNLGRAPLCKEASESISEIAKSYSNLEYDVKAGKRGQRHTHIEGILKELTGAEDAMMVNNNASATMLVLSSMAAGKEVIVSRGELVEIGGSFRIPDIMEQSGATLREVGTTNKTKAIDYDNAIDEEETAALMKVHTSNYKIMGFTEDASLEELVSIGKKRDLPVIFDMGNGLMVNLQEYGVDEPIVREALNTGIDVILFSGDKLLGGPQAGIIAGKKKYIEKMKKHPLARALRVDKMTFAAMEETLKKYRSDDKAKSDIPVLKMITESEESLEKRAKSLAEDIKKANKDLAVEVMKVSDQIGGGSAPMVYLPGYAVSISSGKKTTKSIERALRKNNPPIIARIHEDKLLVSVRTVFEDEMPILSAAFERI